MVQTGLVRIAPVQLSSIEDDRGVNSPMLVALQRELMAVKLLLCPFAHLR